MKIPRRIQVRLALVIASVLLAAGQCMIAPHDPLHHTDTGINVVLHQLGPVLLVLVPLLTLVAAAIHRFRHGTFEAMQTPTLVAVAAAAESAGITLGIAHHGIVLTLLLTAIGWLTSILTVAAGASTVLIVNRRSRRSYLGRSNLVAKPTVPVAIPSLSLIARTDNRRGPPAVAIC